MTVGEPNPPTDSSADERELDLRIRRELLSLATTPEWSGCSKQVLSRVHQRRRFHRVTSLAALFVLVVGGCWVWIDRPHPSAGSASAPEPQDNLELLTVAISDLPSPVMDLSTLEEDSLAWLTFVASLEPQEQE